MQPNICMNNCLETFYEHRQPPFSISYQLVELSTGIFTLKKEKKIDFSCKKNQKFWYRFSKDVDSADTIIPPTIRAFFTCFFGVREIYVYSYKIVILHERCENTIPFLIFCRKSLKYFTSLVSWHAFIRILKKKNSNNGFSMLTIINISTKI